MSITQKRPSYRQRQALITRETIISAAKFLFLTQGYGSTTIENIAARAGLAVSTVYSIFGSKRGLLKAIREQWHSQSRIRETVYSMDPATPALKRVEALAKATREQWETGSEVIMIYTSAAASDPDAAKELEEALHGRRKGLAAFTSGLKPFFANGLDETKASAIVYALCMPELYQELTQSSGWSPEEYQTWLSEVLSHELLGE